MTPSTTERAHSGTPDPAYHGALCRIAAYPSDPMAAELLAACKAGDVAAATRCLDDGADVNSETPFGQTGLVIACSRSHVVIRDGLVAYEGHVALARLLLERGADVNRAWQGGTTPLYISCRMGHVDAARLCLGWGADVNWQNQRGATPLYIASRYGQVEAARLCVERGADLVGNGKRPWLDPCEGARACGHTTLAAWLARVRVAGGWARYVSEPRYALLGLRTLVANGRARRSASELPLPGDDQILNFLFPEAASRGPRMPNAAFRCILCYLWPPSPPLLQPLSALATWLNENEFHGAIRSAIEEAEIDTLHDLFSAEIDEIEEVYRGADVKPLNWARFKRAWLVEKARRPRDLTAWLTECTGPGGHIRTLIEDAFDSLDDLFAEDLDLGEIEEICRGAKPLSWTRFKRAWLAEKAWRTP